MKKNVTEDLAAVQLSATPRNVLFAVGVGHLVYIGQMLEQLGDAEGALIAHRVAQDLSRILQKSAPLIQVPQ